MNPIILRRLVGGGGGANPDAVIAALFANAEKGMVYYPRDLATVFQDRAGTTPGTANGQPFGKILDKSGNDNHATAPSDGARPKLLVDAGQRKAIRSTGAYNLIAENVDFSGCSVVTQVAAFEPEILDGNQQSVFSSGGSPFSTGGFSLDINQNAIGNVGSVFGQGSGSYRFENSGPVLEFGIPAVVIMQITPEGATDADKLKIWVNGHEVAVSTWLTSGTLDNTTFASRDLTLMCRGAAGFFLGNVFFAMAVGRALTAQERADVTACAQASAEVIPSYEIQSYGLSRISRLTPTYAEGSSFSVSEWTTTATSVDVGYISSIYSTYPAFAIVAVYVDNAYYSTTACSSSSGTLTISLPAGSKKVSILNGVQSKPVNTLLGTWVTSATFNAAATKLSPASGGIVVYGDSIACGQLADPVSEKAWSMQVRAALSDHKLSLEAWGVRSLFDDASSAPTLQNLVERITEFSPSTIWLAIGTNDYGLNKWGAAAFGTAYASLLDALHTALPSAVIYAQTPILRTTETANGSGSTLGNYRTQIASAVSTRTAYATLVDGTSFMTTASLDDGLHPNTAGHALYANAVKTVLGI